MVKCERKQAKSCKRLEARCQTRAVQTARLAESCFDSFPLTQTRREGPQANGTRKHGCIESHRHAFAFTVFTEAA